MGALDLSGGCGDARLRRARKAASAFSMESPGDVNGQVAAPYVAGDPVVPISGC
ncbi:hypothetical protein [Kribbella sp. VKM Ac-2571]|uniref:hypothetical protein n=1 Tax=Kribbella sp. VKM Ac-2571 TaxID=2512222 RepID=UPI001414CD94|nr:hypothetical protein [Kribbella sp. VKM Ac-2571]